jgi:hypothetical protein
MATYVLPQVLVFQDFTIAVTAAANPLSSFITGGHAQLIRYDDADEREFGDLGYYEESIATSYLWPSREPGGIVDGDYTKVWIQNALLQYYTDAVSAGDPILVVADYNNRVRSNTTNYTTNGVYARESTLYDRDVKVGDVIRVRGVPTGGGDPVVLWTYVKSIIADEVAAIIASSTDDSSNAQDQAVVAVPTVTQTAGPENCIIATGDGTGYDGIASGKVTETYTITVTESSAAGELPTGRLTILSASGTDDVLSVVPEANGDPTSIGTRGLTVTFTDDDGAACSLSADHGSYGYNDLIQGQVFTVTAQMAWEVVVSTSGGTYIDANSTTYIVEVTKGGAFADTVKPQISVTTVNGFDQSGPHDVTATATAVAIGTEGVTISFDQAGPPTHGPGLVLYDRFYVEVTGVGQGPTRTLELGHNLSDTLTSGDECGVELYIRNALLQVAQNRANYAPVTNWDQTETEITVNAGIIAYDSTWTDDGVLKELGVFSSSDAGYGKLFVEYRAWLPDLCSQITSITDVGDIDDIAGSLTPDNPLKWGVYKALTNSNGTPVLYSAICDPRDPDDWDEPLDLAQQRDDCYGFVPLTRDATVLGLYQAHVGAMSSATEALWRVAWFNLLGVPEIPVVAKGSTVPGHTTATTSDGEDALCVFEDDPNTSGEQYTRLRNPSGNADFIENGVRAGDIVRALYVGDGFGNYTYTEFIVDDVQAEDQIRLMTGPSLPQSVAAKIEIWRNLTLTEESFEIGKDAGAYNDRRIRAVWPDQIETSGTVQDGFYLAAALSGLTSGVVPHQGLTRLAVAGFTDVQRTSRFSKAQLDAMAIAGTWIVMQTPLGDIFTRHAVTTGNYSDINQREEMLTRNVDSISYRFKDFFEPYIGVSNVTPSMAEELQIGIGDLAHNLETEFFTENLGGQLISATIVSFEVSAVFKDRYVCFLEIEVPYALNNFEIHLVV